MFFLVILSALLLFGPAPRALADATITVDANQIKGYINPLVFGQNVMANSNTMWDHRTDSLRKELDDSGIKVKAKIEGLAPTILRFPGGTTADLYLWEDGLGFRTING
jgi:alpha-L-arabinofuranosidase